MDSESVSTNYVFARQNGDKGFDRKGGVKEEREIQGRGKVERGEGQY